MTPYQLNKKGRRKVVDFLLSHANDATKKALIDRENSNILEWFEKVEESLGSRTYTQPEGHLEIGRHYSVTGNPVLATFGPECFDREEIED